MKSKSKIIQEINKIIALHGKFTVADVDAEILSNVSVETLVISLPGKEVLN